MSCLKGIECSLCIFGQNFEHTARNVLATKICLTREMPGWARHMSVSAILGRICRQLTVNSGHHTTYTFYVVQAKVSFRRCVRYIYKAYSRKPLRFKGTVSWDFLQLIFTCLFISVYEYLILNFSKTSPRVIGRFDRSQWYKLVAIPESVTQRCHVNRQIRLSCIILLLMGYDSAISMTPLGGGNCCNNWANWGKYWKRETWELGADF